MSTKFKWDDRAIKSLKDSLFNGLANMAADIQRRAVQNAPVVTGNLRSTIRQEIDGSNEYHIDVVAGGVTGSRGILVDYAYKREIGPNRNPATEHYMANAAREVASGDYIKRYFGGITI